MALPCNPLLASAGEGFFYGLVTAKMAVGARPNRAKLNKNRLDLWLENADTIWYTVSVWYIRSYVN